MIELFINFNLIYWVSICGGEFLVCFLWKICGKIGSFSGQLQSDWENSMWVATAGLEKCRKGGYGLGSTDRLKFLLLIIVTCG